MKSVCILVLFACVAVALGKYTDGHNGRPGCKTSEEVNNKYRNNFDPTRYWVCPSDGGEAIDVQCGTGGYVEKSSSCVDWSEFEWVEPQDPPTLG